MRHRMIKSVVALLAVTATPVVAQENSLLSADLATGSSITAVVEDLISTAEFEALLVEAPTLRGGGGVTQRNLLAERPVEFDLAGPDASDGTALAYFTPRTAIASNTLSAAPVEPGANPLAVSGFTPRYADSYLSLGGSEEESSKPALLNVGLHSRIIIRPGALFNEVSPELDAYQSYNLGVDIGISRFSLGASFLREDSGLLGEMQGYDLGLTYGGAKWSTSLQFEFVNRLEASESLSIEGVNDGFQAVELGASFQASRRLAVTGGLKIFDYETDPALDPTAADYSGLFYLGTRLSF